MQHSSSSGPNDKIGARGFGDPRYLSDAEPLRYAIFFEKVESATASAQGVVITDQLDGAKLDLDTFRLGPISFGKDILITPPQGLSEYTTDVDLRPGKNVIVRAEAKLDKAAGLLTWRFTSLDPSTGLPTEDPLAGFLPPDANPPEGEGQVLFTVKAKRGLATGAEIRNRARIVFDANPFIDTPEWLNTIDGAKPSSRVAPLAAIQCASDINLRWSGTDEGSGICDFTIFVSDDGGPLAPWLLNTTATSAVFRGQAGHTYAFYSLSRDNTLNVEEAHASPDTTVGINAAPPTLSLSGANALTVLYHQPFIDPGARAFDACGVDLTGSIVQTGSVNVNVVGSYVLTYSVSDSLGNSSTATRTVKVVPNPPASKDDCKNVGWQFRTTAKGQPFPNQGQCVSYFNTGNKSDSKTGVVETDSNPALSAISLSGGKDRSKLAEILPRFIT